MMKPGDRNGAGGATLAAALAGDQGAFTTLAESHRRELQAHCYRMLGSFNDAEDMVQDTLLKAWRSRATFQGRGSFRAWLYGIATNTCLDFLADNPHRVLAREAETPPPQSPSNGSPRPAGEPPAGEASADVPWLQPFPDCLLEPASPQELAPDAAAVSRQTIGLAFLVAVQFLPAKQRAALILSDVLEWSAKETADLLELSVASVNSALQRARATLRERQPRLGQEWKPGVDADQQQRTLLEQYVSATERGDVVRLAALLREDVRFSMPPTPGFYVGRDTVVGSWVEGGFGADWFGAFRCLLTRANGMPAVANYVRKPGENIFRPMAVDVLEIEDGLISEITAFPLDSIVRAFDLPAEL